MVFFYPSHNTIHDTDSTVQHENFEIILGKVLFDTVTNRIENVG
jgi:hypothetical protein